MRQWEGVPCAETLREERAWTGWGVQCLICIIKGNRRETGIEMERSEGDGVKKRK